MQERFRHSPIHLEHTPSEEPNLFLPILADTLESALSRSTGKVVIMHERDDFSPKISEAVYIMSARGTLLSDSYAYLHFLTDNGVEPTPTQLKYFKDSLHPNFTGFSRDEVNLIENFQSRYKGRVLIRPHFTFFPTDDDKVEKAREEFDEKGKYTAMNGEFRKGLPYYKNVVRSLATEIRDEDISAANIIGLEALDNNVSLVLGNYLPTRTGISHELKIRGFSSTTHNPAKQEGLYLYTPFDAMMRRLRFLGSKGITQEDWLRNFFQNCITFVILGVHENYDPSDFSRQDVLRFAYQVVGNITIEQINDFEKDTKNQDIGNAVEKLIHRKTGG